MDGGVTPEVDWLGAFPPVEPEDDVVLLFDAPALLNCSLFVGADPPCANA
jgi:hypothetical protein